jgi:DNA-binding transcriptional LysR family regulator
MQINWNHRDLRVFLALAETASFRQTATRIHLSQSAVSGVIVRLEQMLEVKLFDRTTRSVHLTAAGEIFLEQALLMNEQSQEALRLVRNVNDLKSGSVRLAALPSLAATIIPEVMARFAAKYPGVQLVLHDTLSGPAFDLVASGKVDFAITAANPAYSDLDHSELASDGFVLLLATSHSQARPRKPLKWADTFAMTHISMPLPASVRQYADAAYMHHRQRFLPSYEVEHIATIHAMVKAGLGVAALPELAAKFISQEGVVSRKLVEPDIRRPLGLVMRRNRSFSPAVNEMVRMLKLAFK